MPFLSKQFNFYGFTGIFVLILSITAFVFLLNASCTQQNNGTKLETIQIAGSITGFLLFVVSFYNIDIVLYMSKSIVYTIITIGARGWVEDDKLKTNEYFLKSSSVVDFSDDYSCQWYSVLLKKLHFEEKVDSFLMMDFAGVSLPFKNKHTTKYPILFHKNYVECAFKSDVDIKTDIAFRIQHLPVFVQLKKRGSNFDEALQHLIANALSISIGGYSLISPVLLGNADRRGDPTAEQYIRWVQASALMPRMVMAHAPWDYDSQTLEYVKKFTTLHAQYSSTIIELARKRITSGSPIIRPMWYVAPEDARTYLISDQYMLGDDILVAPVLASGQRERMVYLPSGTWIDQRNNRQYTGPADIKVSVPLDELAYFKKG